MGLLDKFKRKVETTLAESRLEEELIYKHILEEMDSGVIREGLYAKAMANSNGDEAKAKSLYMKYRLQSVKDAMGGNSYLEYVGNLKLEEREKKNKLNKAKSPKNKPLSTAEVERIKKFKEVKAANRREKKLMSEGKKIIAANKKHKQIAANKNQKKPLSSKEVERLRKFHEIKAARRNNN
jgi:hypothetical protein